MEYSNIKEARFISRPNRFIAEIEIDGIKHVAHVKNTGRCKELLIPGARLMVDEVHATHRKTCYDVVAVYKGDMLINMDSQIPNKVFAQWVLSSGYFGQVSRMKAECTYGSSRLDFYIEAGERRIFAEVKGVTLEQDGVVMFPDAPTERGLKHIQELCGCVRDGFEGYIVFIVQLKGARYFTPNNVTHKAFGDALAVAISKGVQVIALECDVTETSIEATGFVPVHI